jgi:hypothetical protein
VSTQNPVPVLNLVCAREPLPDVGPTVFLAGPTPTAGAVPSWRPAALAELARQWADQPAAGEQELTVLSPESRGGKRAAHYDDQVDWETAARAAATAILFWIPRDLATLPGFTTNVEFGLDAASGRAVLGCPPDCPNPERNRYLIYVARRHGVPVRESLPATVAAALAIVTATAAAGPARAPYNQVRRSPDGTAIAWHRPEVEDDDAQPWLVVEEHPIYGVGHTWHPYEHVAGWTVLATPPATAPASTDDAVPGPAAR